MAASTAGATLFVWGTWAGMLLGNLLLVNKYTTNYPYSDELYLLDQSHTLQWLWAQWSEHRVPLAKLIWLAILKLTNYDFHVATSISVLTVGATVFAMIITARKLRGCTTFSDSFFPLAFLSFGQAFNFLWWWVFNHILAPLMACCALIIILLWGKQLTPKYAVLTGMCLVLLSLSGPGGLPYALALAIWLGYQGALHWRSRFDIHARRNGLLMLGLAGLVVLLVGLYFVGYDHALGISARLPDMRLSDYLQTSTQILSISLGPGVRPYWRVARWVVLALLLLGVAVLIGTLVKEPLERMRVLGLLFFIGATSVIVLIVGRARAGFGEDYALSGVYLNMALPALCCTYFVWIIYPKYLSSLIQMSCFTGVCLLFLPNLDSGLGLANFFSSMRRAFEQDLQAGVPPFILAERHVDFLNPASESAKGNDLLLQQMQHAGIPQFRDMAQNPVFREVAIPVVTAGTNQVRWDNGVAYSHGTDVSQSSLDFALGDPGFVYAIRLGYIYKDQTIGWAVFRMSWGDGDYNKGSKDVAAGCNDGINMILVTSPRDMWAKRFRSGAQKLTIWVNSKIDRFRVCPDVRPFSFALSEIALLVP